MSSSLPFDYKTETHFVSIKPENKREALLKYGIDAKAFELPTDTCADMLNYIKRGEMDRTYPKDARVAHIKNILETFYGHIVQYRDRHGTVVSFRMKNIRKLGYDKRKSGNKNIGDIEVCVKNSNRKNKPICLWVDAVKLTIV